MVGAELLGLGSWGIALLAVDALATLAGGTALLAIPFRRLRPRARRIAAFAATFVLSSIAFLRASGEARDLAFARLAQRSEPLINAIEQYESAHGRPPATLTDLVPSHLPSVPTTGMPAYPNYEYEVFPPNVARKLDGLGSRDRNSDAEWELRVPCSIGVLNWDVFFYRPGEAYPDHAYGGYVERIGRWAYVHE